VGRPFELQISLGDMDLEDAFRVTLQADRAGCSVGELLDLVFPRDEQARSDLRATLDVADNPDLPAMYDSLLDTFQGWRDGVYALRLFANHGPEVAASEMVYDHLSLRRAEGQDGATPLLDLVVDAPYDSLRFLAQRGYCSSKEELLAWLQTRMLLYFMDKHQFRLELSPLEEINLALLPLAEQLRLEDIIAPSDETESFAITASGRRLISTMIAETESNIDRFDLFKDVRHDADAGLVEFNTGHGEDLRVDAYEAEGLDPVLTVFLLLMYDGTFEEFSDRWREAIHDDQLFNDLLSPVVDRVRAEEVDIEWIIENGYTHNEQREEAARDLGTQREILKRVRAILPPTDTVDQGR
jgi:hypothetical protein